MAEPEHESEQRVIIVGVGLIGGSIAAAVRQRLPACEVTGVGRNEKRLAAAQDAGLLTSFTTQMTPELLGSRCIVVICLPVHLIADEVLQTARLASPEVLITDAGSVKGVICRDVAAHAIASRHFVGAHPIAGGEQGGFEHAEADLFVDRICVVTPTDDRERTERTRQFWKSLGSQVISMSPEEHDRRLAVTSHLPHLMAAVTTAVVGRENLSLTGSGFRDATRIAAGDPGLWRAIFAGNRAEVAAAVSAAQEILEQYRTLLITEDDEALESMLRDAAECRAALHGNCDT